jgi:hypothetical protein
MMMKATTRDTLTLLHLLGCTIGVTLMGLSWFIDEGHEATAGWSALFGGALLIRLSLSAALQFRDWKARAEMVLGIWLIASPWVLHFERLHSVTVVHHVVGLATVGLGALGLWYTSASMGPQGDQPRLWLEARETDRDGRAGAC